MAKNGKTPEEKIYNYVAKNPGTTAEKVRLDLVLPEGTNIGRVLRKLRDSKHLKSKGTTRATAYTATAKALA